MTSAIISPLCWRRTEVAAPVEIGDPPPRRCQPLGPPPHPIRRSATGEGRCRPVLRRPGRLTAEPIRRRTAPGPFGNNGFGAGIAMASGYGDRPWVFRAGPGSSGSARRAVTSPSFSDARRRADDAAPRSVLSAGSATMPSAATPPRDRARLTGIRCGRERIPWCRRAIDPGEAGFIAASPARSLSSDSDGIFGGEPRQASPIMRSALVGSVTPASLGRARRLHGGAVDGQMAWPA